MRSKTDVEKAEARFWKAHRRFVCVERAALRRMTHEQRAKVVAMMEGHERRWGGVARFALQRMAAFAQTASDKERMLLADEINAYSEELEQMASSFPLCAGDRLIAWFLDLIRWRPRSTAS